MERLEGLRQPAELVWDDRAVPHIFAGSYRDAIFLQGYAHAMDRLWQMDFSTRAAAGRIAEIVGPAAIDFDREKRRLGLPESARAAEANYRNYPETYELLEAYSAGVNAYIESLSPHEWPLEFKLLQYSPEPWSPYKTALFSKNMALVLCRKNADLGMSNVRAVLGDSLFTVLFPEELDGEAPIIAGAEYPQSEVRPALLDSLAGIKHVLFGTGYRDTLPVQSGIGSNNWALMPDKTAAGYALLANDPHLSLSLPSVWHESHIVCPETQVYGVGFPGAPGIIIGFNKDIAWGFTNTGIDVFDWYAIDWLDDQTEVYRLGDSSYSVSHRIDTIFVKNAMPVYDTVKLTHFGPVFSDDPGSPYYRLAARWVVHDAFDTDELGTFPGLNLSHDVRGYRQSIAGHNAPAQNIIYADRKGNIALTVQGRFPLKRAQQGRFILDGTDTTALWAGYVDAAYQPFLLNPPSGHLSSANQRPTDAHYPFYYNSGDFRPYRGTILQEKLDSLREATPKDMMALQLDNESLHAQLMLGAMLPATTDSLFSDAERLWRDSLAVWDRRYRRTAKTPILFELWRDSFVTAALDELEVYRDRLTLAEPDDWTLAQLITEAPGHVIWDDRRTGKREQVHDMLWRSYRDAAGAFFRLIESNPELDWGRKKATRVSHLARIEAFSSGVLYTSGASEALNATRRDHGPSWRMIVECGPRMRGWGIYPGGQSGNPGSPGYTQMLEDWQEGRYYPLIFVDTPEEIEHKSRHWVINR